MFARRNEPDLKGNPGLQDGLRDALRERGGQVLLHGDTGVGKSSLLKYAAEDEELDLLVVECLSSHSYDDLIETAVRKVVDVREVARTENRNLEATAGASGKWFSLITLKGEVKGGKGSSKSFEVVEQSPLDVLLTAMEKSGKKLFVLDNFQNVKDENTRTLVAQTMELMSDRANDTGDIKTVVIGIADDAVSLIGGSGSYRRRTTEIGVPRMPDDEIREIFSKGFDLLDVTVPDDVIDQLVFFSDGFPYFAHLLGLYVARAARSKGSEVTDEVLESALARAIQAVDESFSDRVRAAREAGGGVRPRKRIMEILADSPQRVWKASEVIAEWERRYDDPRSDYAFLHVALAQLMKDKHGAILKRRGPRNKYIYQFADPQMRPFLRITAEAADGDAAA